MLLVIDTLLVLFILRVLLFFWILIMLLIFSVLFVFLLFIWLIVFLIKRLHSVERWRQVLLLSVHDVMLHDALLA